MAGGRALALAFVVGCNAIAGIDELRPNEAASTSAASATGTGGMSDGGRGGSRPAASSSGQGVGGAGGKQSECATQYGDVPGFMLCGETDMNCTFYALVQPETCASLCSHRGGECLQVFNNANDVPTCRVADSQSCNDATLLDAICSCSQGCGQGPPCGPNKTCTGGMCH